MENLQSLGILDLIFIAILSISVLLGLIRGVIREVLSLAGLIASIYCAFTFSEYLSQKYVSQFLNDARISYIVTFALVIIGALFAVTLVNLFFSSLLKASGLSFLNRIFGAIFGIIRGAAICSLLVMMMSLIPGLSANSWWKQSDFVPFFQRLTVKTMQNLPKNVVNYVESAQNSVANTANGLLPNAANNANNAGANNTNTAQPINLESTENSHQATINGTTARPQAATSQQQSN